MHKVSIIVPAYNEEKRIGRMLEKYSQFFDALVNEKKLDYEIIVVINNTKDRTEEIVSELVARNKKVKYLNFKRGGKGFAVVEGFKDALKRDSDLIGFVDADMATSPEEFYKLIRAINGFDGVIASRYVEGAVVYPAFNFRRIIVARIFNFMVRALFLINFKDTQCGAKLFNKPASREITSTVRMSQWAFDVELLYALKKKGFRVKEIPTTWREVEGSNIKIIKSSIQMFLSLIQLRAVNSRLKKLLKPMKPVIGLVWRIIY